MARMMAPYKVFAIENGIRVFGRRKRVQELYVNVQDLKRLVRKFELYFQDEKAQLVNNFGDPAAQKLFLESPIQLPQKDLPWAEELVKTLLKKYDKRLKGSEENAYTLLDEKVKVIQKAAMAEFLKDLADKAPADKHAVVVRASFNPIDEFKTNFFKRLEAIQKDASSEDTPIIDNMYKGVWLAFSAQAYSTKEKLLALIIQEHLFFCTNNHRMVVEYR